MAAKAKGKRKSKKGGAKSASQKSAARRGAGSKRRAAERRAAQPAQEGPTDELLSMDQAIEILKTSRPTFYRWLREGKIRGMKLGRQWRFYRDDVERFLRGEEPRIEPPSWWIPSTDSTVSGSGEYS